MLDPKKFFGDHPVPRIDKIKVRSHPQSIHVLRLDQIHPQLSGNKFFKLKYHFLHAHSNELKLVGIGGPYSNLLHSLAYGGQLFSIPTKAILKGPVPKRLSTTLLDCSDWGMELEFIDRDQYKEIQDHPEKFKSKPNESFLALGGNDELGLKGLEEMFHSLKDEFDLYGVSVGSGGTIKALDKITSSKKRILAFPAIKGIKADFVPSRSEIIEGYDFGGLGKTSKELIGFIKQFQSDHSISLDPVYTGKMFFGIFDLLNNGFFDKDARILCIHTGGLQGRRGVSDLGS